jgi:GDPmannose 4,6-dehydratase
MLQQDAPDDYVIATGRQFSVRQFVEQAGREIGLEIEFRGVGLEEQGVVSKLNLDKANAILADRHIAASRLQPGAVVVKVDPRYFRPTEVETLLGDAGKAREKLGWQPQISFEELVTEMAREDLLLAAKDQIVNQAGFIVHEPRE